MCCSVCSTRSGGTGIATIPLAASRRGCSAIARKRAIDVLRRRHANVVPIEELRDIAGDDGRELAERYARASEVRSALERLSTEQREVLTLAYFGDLTQVEIAERLGVPLGTVKARAFRGLRRLADILGGAG